MTVNAQAVALLENALEAVKAGTYDGVGVILVKAGDVAVQTAADGGAAPMLHIGAGQMQRQILNQIFPQQSSPLVRVRDRVLS